MSVVIDGLVTDFIAVMKRIGEIDGDAATEDFLDRLEAATPHNEPSYISGMQAIAVFYQDEE